jgi:hypothetical protein
MLEKQGDADLLLDPERIFNADKTCVLLDSSSSRAVAPIETKNVYQIKDKLVFL